MATQSQAQLLRATARIIKHYCPALPRLPLQFASQLAGLACVLLPVAAPAELLVEHPRLYFQVNRISSLAGARALCDDGSRPDEGFRYVSAQAACSSLDACWPNVAPHIAEAKDYYTAAINSGSAQSSGGRCDYDGGAGIYRWTGASVDAFLCSPGFDFNDSTGLCEKGQPECDEDGTTDAPVNISTGNKSISEVDFESAGNSLLRFERHWTSQNMVWEFSYRQRLKETVASRRHYVRIYRPSGWDVTFRETNGVWAPEARTKDVLTSDGSNWVYTMASGAKEWYNAAGQLTRIRHADGRGLSVSYPATNPATVVVTDDYGKQLILTLNALADRVVAMTDPDGAVYEYDYNAGGNLEYVTFPADGATPAPVRRYHYNDSVDSRLVTRITDENGDVYKTIQYSGSTRRPISSGMSNGTVGQSTFDYTAINDVTDPRVTVTNALGKQAVYHLDFLYGSVVVKQVEGVAQPSTGCLADVRSREYYPDTGWLKYDTDKAGNKTYYEYLTDGFRRGLVKLRIEGEGSAEPRTFNFKYFYTRQIKEEILQGVRRTEYTYHANGKEHTRTETDLTAQADVPTRTWTTTYTYHNPGTDTQVATVTVDGPRTDVTDTTVTEYSAEGYLVKTTNALGQITQYQDHNSRGQPRRVIDSNGIITDMTYTARGWLDTVTQNVGGRNALTAMEYDKVGQLTGVTLPDGVHVAFRYDAAHRLYETENALGEILRYELDAAGNKDEILYKNGGGSTAQKVNYDFDGLSRLWKEFGSYGQQTEYTHDDKDHLTTITALKTTGDLVTGQAFDGQNRLQHVTDADNENLFIEYDDEDRVDRITDQRGLVTDYIYDGFGDLQQLISPDTGTTFYDYDAAGNRTRQSDARGVVTNYTYDAMNRVKTIKYPGAPAKDIAYTYDNYSFGPLACTTCNGQLSILQDASGSTLYFYDTLGRIDKRTNVVKVPGGGTASLTTDFDFSPAGRLEQIAYPNGQVVKYGFDAAGQINAVRYKSQAPTDPLKNIATAMTYQPFGPLNGARYGNNLILSRSYDLDGRLDTQTITGVQSLDYGYDEVDNINAIDNLIDNSRDELFDYDNLNRLESASGKYGAVYYDYDAAGNREGRAIVRGASVVLEDHQIDPNSNRLDQINITDGTTPKTREFQYDAAGNLTQEKRADGTYVKPAYDHTNRMKGISN